MSSYLFHDAIQFKPISRTPIWLMRQAGRYLDEYQQVRAKYDFKTVCKTPELATEVTLQPITKFGFDAAILFSDILVIPEALGQNLEFHEGHGPQLSPQILDRKSLEAMVPETLEENLEYVAKAVAMINAALPKDIPLIGFSGSPFTLATYMIEGKPSRNFAMIKTMLYQDPDLLTDLLELLRNAVIRYCKMQIQAGAKAIQIFDTWGGILPPHLYKHFSAKYMIEITQALQNFDVPIILFSKGGFELLQELKDSGADMLGVDWMTDIQKAKDLVDGQCALQGNLDPTALYGSKESIHREVGRILNVFGNKSGHVFNLGHGILPDIPVDNVYTLVQEVQEQSSKLYSQK